ncbi:MAG: hemolysin family protein [Chloroflexi bacterium]|nr:hemolysin family protein [Chloroflexota bacterium]MCY3580961.1 hemolysin family protein [Chloroflexota bacterium]MCY3717637.1 hemolysin family protein [Chloroflexota bacterium]MDE2650306.1 hemolysin family protein [Chloroflexota bacterium]MXX51736.1 HlyC/CorC family transporter [Chloroflexota bacterium]
MDSLIHSGIPILAAGSATGGAGEWSALIFYIVIALGISFLCSIWEAAMLSTPVSHIELLVEQGSRAGEIMQGLRQNVEHPISAILTLNTIAHTVGAAGAGAEATAIFGSEYFGIISALLTLLILVFSEIIPKTLGAVYAKPLTPFTAWSLRALLILFKPAVFAFEFVTRAMRPDEDAPTVTRSELQVMARISAEEGGIRERENRIVANLLQLAEVQVETIMTPRTVMLSFRIDATIGDIMREHPVLPFSRIPVYGESADDIHGYVLRHEIYKRAAAAEHAVLLQDIARQLQVVPETNSVAQVLDEFISKQDHIFLVIDEYGGTAGLITLEDAVETLLGIEILDESDRVADLRDLARRRYERQQATPQPLGPASAE